MSLPAFHTAIGMSFPFIIWLFIYTKVKRITSRMLLWLIFAMGFCGVWSEVPDIPTFLPQQYKYLEHVIMESPFVNIFFFHGFLDTHQAEDRGLLTGTIMIFIMFFTIMFALIKTIKENQKKIELIKIMQSKNEKVQIKKTITPLFNDIIDIHCHLLPGIDDGPQTLNESLQMAKKLVENGISTVIATPHLPWKNSYDVEKIYVAYSKFKKLLLEQKFHLNILLGSDIRLSHDLIQHLNNGRVIPLAKSRYFLLELDHFTIPEGLENFLDNCILENWYPIITHPERNAVLLHERERIDALSKKGMLFQITAGSISGLFGDNARELSEYMLTQGMIDFIASDAHSSRMRLEVFQKGIQKSVDLIGKETVKKLLIDNPQKILLNQSINKSIRNSTNRSNG